jgi:hypothetical protein
MYSKCCRTARSLIIIAAMPGCSHHFLLTVAFASLAPMKMFPLRDTIGIGLSSEYILFLLIYTVWGLLPIDAEVDLSGGLDLMGRYVSQTLEFAGHAVLSLLSLMLHRLLLLSTEKCVKFFRRFVLILRWRWADLGCMVLRSNELCVESLRYMEVCTIDI